MAVLIIGTEFIEVFSDLYLQRIYLVRNQNGIQLITAP